MSASALLLDPIATNPGRETPAWLAGRQSKARKRFLALGLPTRRLEEWKYTDVGSLGRTAWEAPGAQPADLTREHLENRIVPVLGCNLLVFVNGNLAPDLSAPTALSGHSGIAGLADALAAARDSLEPHLARTASFEDASFEALNTASFSDGAWIVLDRKRDPNQPLHIVHVSAPGRAPTLSHPRTLIRVEPGAQAVVIEDFVTFGSGESFTNSVTEVVVGTDAQIDLIRLQREDSDVSHLGTVGVRQQRDSSFRFHSIALGGGLIRNDVRVALEEPGADCLLSGLFLARHDEHVDNQTFVDHMQPHCSSRELYKGILEGRSRGVFHGKILVREDAQHTDARQQNRNLLLSADASIQSMPQLEIRADDVKCTHGSATGSLDEDALFYLRARGIDRQRARAILTRAFAMEIIDEIPVEALRETLAELLLQRFESNSSEATQ